jgi:hypothetical protein
MSGTEKLFGLDTTMRANPIAHRKDAKNAEQKKKTLCALCDFAVNYYC